MFGNNYVISVFILATEVVGKIKWHCPAYGNMEALYSKSCLKQTLKNRQNKGLKDCLLLNAGQKYCRMLPLGAFCNTFYLH